MRLQITKSKNAECFYVVKSVNNDGRRSNRVVERLGNLEEVRAKANGQEPHEWAKAYVDKLNEEIAEGREGEVLLRLSPGKKMDAQQNVKRNVGQLYLKKLYSDRESVSSASYPTNLRSSICLSSSPSL